MRHTVRGFRLLRGPHLGLFVLSVLACSRRADDVYGEGALPVIARWKTSSITLSFVPSATVLDHDARISLMEAADIWTKLLVGCKTPKLVVASAATGDVKRNGRSQVVLRTERWCPDGLPTTECYDARRAALTHLHLALDGSALVVEADVEVNAVDFSWSSRQDERHVSFLRVFIHELGHVLGLGEACLSSLDSPRPGQGPCTADPFRDSAMYPGVFAPHSKLPLAPVLPGKRERETLCAAYEQ